MTGRANTRISELIVRQSWSQETNYARVSEVKLAADNISHKQTATVKSSLQLIFYIYFVVSFNTSSIRYYEPFRPFRLKAC